MELEWDVRQWERERKKERKRDGWNLIYDSRSEFFGFFFCAAHATVTVHPLTDGWSHSRAVHHDNGSFPLTWLSHRWICRAVGRDQVRDDEFGTALIAAIHTGRLAHVVVLTNWRRNPNETSSGTPGLMWRVHRLWFSFILFYFICLFFLPFFVFASPGRSTAPSTNSS